MSNCVISGDLKCVIFDMDGVLYDSMKNHEATWVECMKKVGIDFPPEEAYLQEGKPGYDTIAYAFEKYLGNEVTQEDKEAIYNEKVRLMALAPKVEKMPMMNELIYFLREKGMAIWVVTGSKQPTLLDKLGSDFGIDPNQIVSAKDVMNGKPFPEPYLKAVEGSGYKAEECLVVENAPLGVKSAKAAGITTIAVNTGILEDAVLANEGADVVLPNTRSLYSYIVERV